MTAAPPIASRWMDFLVTIYQGGQPPLLGTVDIKVIEEKAREAMKDDIRKSLSFITESYGSNCLLVSGIYVHIWQRWYLLNRPRKQKSVWKV